MLYEVITANVPSFPTRLSTLSLRRLPLEEKTAMYDLSVNLREMGGILAGSLEYRADLFDAATATRIASHLQTLFRTVVANPAGEIATLPLMPEAEEFRVTSEFNDTRRDWPPTAVHALFEMQAQRTPDAIAVEDRCGCLTYRELDHQADQLAAHLGSIGVQSGDLVGLCVERSARMVIGLLGILKSGAAYVPLDPTFPGARLASYNFV